MPSEVGRSLGRGKKKGLTHREVMHKRHLKRKKKEAKNKKDRKMKLLKEYQELNKVKFSSKKDTSMAIMELVEDVKEKIPSGVYLDIMNQLMALNKEKETLSPIPRNTTVLGPEQFEDDPDEDYIMDYFRDRYFYDRQGYRGYIYNEMNNINENTIINDRPHNTLTTINDPIEPQANNIVSQLSNTISRVNREDTTIRGTWREAGTHWEIQRDVQSYLNR